MSKKVKKILTLLLCIVMVVSFTACGGNETAAPSGSGDNTQTGEQTSVETGETEIEGRSAIIFSTTCEEGASVVVLREEESLETYDGMRLMAGDYVACTTGAQCCVRIDDDKNVLLNNDTVIEVSELKDGELKLALVGGEFFCDVQNKLADDETMEFEVGGTTMSIRGTSFSGIAEYATNNPSMQASLYRVELINHNLNSGSGNSFVNPEIYDGQKEEHVFDGNVLISDEIGNQKYLVGGQSQLIHLNEDGKSDISEKTKVAKATELMEMYAAENPDYLKKIEEVGWKKDKNAITLDPQRVIENAERASLDLGLENKWNLELSNPTTKKDNANKQVEQSDSDNINTEAKELPITITGDCGKHSGNVGKFDKSKHAKLECGHYACELGIHTKCRHCGEYLCNGEDHTKRLGCEHYACEEGKHLLLPCGKHFECRVKDINAHGICVYCGGCLCDGGDHTTTLECGHHSCAVSDNTAHTKCTCCGGYICDGKDHTSVLSCGHHACESGDHTLGVCGYHYACKEGYSVPGHSFGACGYINGTPYTPMITLACGHTVYPGQEAGHGFCSACLERECNGQDHSQLKCGHYVCSTATDTDHTEEHAIYKCGVHCNWSSGTDAQGEVLSGEGFTHQLEDCGAHYKCCIDVEDETHRTIDDNGNYQCGGPGLCVTCGEISEGQLRTAAVKSCEHCVKAGNSYCLKHWNADDHAVCASCNNVKCKTLGTYYKCASCSTYYCDVCYKPSNANNPVIAIGPLMLKCDNCSEYYCSACSSEKLTRCSGTYDGALNGSCTRYICNCCKDDIADINEESTGWRHCSTCTDYYCSNHASQDIHNPEHIAIAKKQPQ